MGLVSRFKEESGQFKKQQKNRFTSTVPVEETNGRFDGNCGGNEWMMTVFSHMRCRGGNEVAYERMDDLMKVEQSVRQSANGWKLSLVVRDAYEGNEAAHERTNEMTTHE